MLVQVFAFYMVLVTERSLRPGLASREISIDYLRNRGCLTSPMGHAMAPKASWWWISEREN